MTKHSARTNVEGLRHVRGAALGADLMKFVFTSTTGTLAISDSPVVTEDDPLFAQVGMAV